MTIHAFSNTKLPGKGNRGRKGGMEKRQGGKEKRIERSEDRENNSWSQIFLFHSIITDNP